MKFSVWLLSVILLCLLLYTCSHQLIKVRAQATELEAAQAMAQTLASVVNKSATWISNKPLSQWDGCSISSAGLYSCDFSKRWLSGSLDLTKLPANITSFKIYTNKISGTANLVALSPNLVTLQLHFNQFSGDINLKSLPSTLTGLWINNNQITGQMDVSLLPVSMNTFDASSNQFTSLNLGSQGLRRITNLQYFVIAFNRQMSSPFDFSKLPAKMIKLDVNGCRLTGAIQFPSTGLPATLTTLNVYNNQFAGTLDLSKLNPGMTHLYGGYNQLYGNLDISNLPDSLRVLSLYNNQFTRLLTSLNGKKFGSNASTSQLQYLQLYSNRIAHDFGQLLNAPLPSKLYELNLANNMLYGTLDMSLFPASTVHVYLYTNRLSGQLTLKFKPKMQTMHLAANLFNKQLVFGGSMPAGLKTLSLYSNRGINGTMKNLGYLRSSKLTSLSIYSNLGISGTMQDFLNNLPATIQHLYAYDTGLTGTVSIASLKATLIKIQLGPSNYLSGPLDLTQLKTGIEEILFHRCKFDGTINFSRLPSTLKKLYLYTNKFTKVTGVGGLKASKLNVLHLSSIPTLNTALQPIFTYLPITLKEFYGAGSQFTGSFDTATIPPSLTELQIQGNQLESTINWSALKLKPKLTNLYLNQNKFYGNVDLRNLPSGLRMLYVRQNNFNGSLLFSPGLKNSKLTYLVIDRNPFNNKIVANTFIREFPPTLNEFRYFASTTTGGIFTGSLNLGLLSAKLLVFQLYYNPGMWGTPNLALLKEGIQNLCIHQNNFQGDLDLSNLPSTLNSICLGDSKFSETDLNNSNFTHLNQLGALYFQNSQVGGEMNKFVDKLPAQGKLRTLYLYNNKISGTLNTAKLPASLYNFRFYENQVSGTINLRTLPPPMVYFSAQGNQLRGSVDLSSLPPSLYTLHLERNRLDGTIKLDNLNKHQSLRQLYLMDNKLRGTLDLASLPTRLDDFRVQNNSLSGPIGEFSHVPNLRTFNAESNNLEGNVDVTQITSRAVKYAINNNPRLIGVVDYLSMNGAAQKSLILGGNGFHAYITSYRAAQPPDMVYSYRPSKPLLLNVRCDFTNLHAKNFIGNYECIFPQDRNYAPLTGQFYVSASICNFPRKNITFSFGKFFNMNLAAGKNSLLRKGPLPTSLSVWLNTTYLPMAPRPATCTRTLTISLSLPASPECPIPLLQTIPGVTNEEHMRGVIVSFNASNTNNVTTSVPSMVTVQLTLPGGWDWSADRIPVDSSTTQFIVVDNSGRLEPQGFITLIVPLLSTLSWERSSTQPSQLSLSIPMHSDFSLSLDENIQIVLNATALLMQNCEKETMSPNIPLTVHSTSALIPMAAAEAVTATTVSAAAAGSLVGGGGAAIADTQALLVVEQMSCGRPLDKAKTSKFTWFLSPFFNRGLMITILGNIALVALGTSIHALFGFCRSKQNEGTPLLEGFRASRFPSMSFSVALLFLQGTSFASLSAVLKFNGDGALFVAGLFGTLVCLSLIFGQIYLLRKYVVVRRYMPYDEFESKHCLLRQFYPMGRWYPASERQAFGRLYHNMNHKSFWWAVFHPVNAILINILASLPIESNSGCKAIYGTLGAYFFLVAIIHAVIRPFRIPFHNFIVPCVFSCFGVMLTCKIFSVEKTNVTANKVQSISTLVLMGLLVFRSIYDGGRNLMESCRWGPKHAEKNNEQLNGELSQALIIAEKEENGDVKGSNSMTEEVDGEINTATSTANDKGGRERNNNKGEEIDQSVLKVVTSAASVADGSSTDREEEMREFTRPKKKSKHSPSSNDDDGVEMDWEKRLTSYLEARAPAKVPMVQQMLQKYSGKEETLFKALTSKLGPDPKRRTKAMQQDKETEKIERIQEVKETNCPAENKKVKDIKEESRKTKRKMQNKEKDEENEESNKKVEIERQVEDEKKSTEEDQRQEEDEGSSEEEEKPAGSYVTLHNDEEEIQSGLILEPPPSEKKTKKGKKGKKRQSKRHHSDEEDDDTEQKEVGFNPLSKQSSNPLGAHEEESMLMADIPPPPSAQGDEPLPPPNADNIFNMKAPSSKSRPSWQDDDDL